MKLIIAGATGFVATEVVRQSLLRPEITSVIALARKPVSLPEQPDAGSDASKLKSVIVRDYAGYPEEVMEELSGADACIWTVAITPSKSKGYPFDEVKRVCQTSTMAGLKAMHEASSSRPFRFLYMSGIAAERDRTRTPRYMPEYCWMRGATENEILAYAAESKGEIEVCVAKPGLITGQGMIQSTMATALGFTIRLPTIHVQTLTAAVLDQVVEGFSKEPLLSEDLERLVKK